MYLLDANAFITPFHTGQLNALAKSLRYPPDKTKELLENWFSQGIISGKLKITRDVKDEILAKEGPGYDLLKTLDGKYTPLIPTEQDTYKILEEIGRFVRENYEPQHASAFLDKGADPILVALAKTYNYTIITLEGHDIPQVNNYTGIIQASKVRLPFVAFAFGVRCISLMTAFIEEPLIQLKRE